MLRHSQLIVVRSEARSESSRRVRLTLLYSPLTVGFQDFISQRRLDIETDVPFVRSPVKVNSLS